MGPDTVATEQIYADAVRIVRDWSPNAAVADTAGGTTLITISESDNPPNDHAFGHRADETWAAEVKDDLSQVARSTLAAIWRFRTRRMGRWRPWQTSTLPRSGPVCWAWGFSRAFVSFGRRRPKHMAL